MNIPNNKQKKDSEERIEKVFLQLIQNKDIQEIKVSKICELAKVNRTTFYANYIDIYDLVEKVRNRMILEFASMYENSGGHTHDNYLKLFKNIKGNQIFYKTYFKLQFDVDYNITYFDETLAKEKFDNKYIDYHCEFFKAGITAVIKKWLNSGCKESPEEILEIIESEYKSNN